MMKTREKHEKKKKLPNAPFNKPSKDIKVGQFRFIDINTISSGYVKPSKSLEALERAVKEKAFEGLKVNDSEI